MGATHFSGPIVLGSGSVEVLTGADTIVPTDSGKTFFLDAAAGATVTLPSLVSGMRFKFVVTSAFATTNWVVASAEGDNISGNLVVAGAHVASAESVGDWIELIADTANSQWIVSGVAGLSGGITATDPS